MTANEVRKKYIDFFKASPRDHKEIDPAPLVLENDPTTLFTSSGMQPLVPYLMGEPYYDKNGKQLKRLVDSQPSIRTVDIDEVGDNRHLTFFEMLGNWSLGDYFKEEQLNWFYSFLTKELQLDKEKLWVSIFEGNDRVSKDQESITIWKKIGVPEKRIIAYGVSKNWWSRTGTPQQMPVGEIGGPDSEVFYDFGEELGLHDKSEFSKKECHPNCDCGRFMEVGNSVFIQYKKIGKDKLEELPQKNVDFGGGFERILAVANNEPDIYKTGLFDSLIKIIENSVGVRYDSDFETTRSLRIIADHIKASVMLITAGVYPSNKQHGYILRRLLRRLSIKFTSLSKSDFNSAPLINDLGEEVLRIYDGNEQIGINRAKQKENVRKVITEEIARFDKTLDRGLRVVNKLDNIDGKVAFDLYQSYGFPIELTKEIAKDRGQIINKKVFEKEFEKHKNKSRSASAGVFKGGLADHSPDVIRYHTAAHLLLMALRKVLGDKVVQKGQNITKDRTRFDFPFPRKLTDEEIKRVEDIINKVIEKDLPVEFKVMPKSEALKTGAIHAFTEKYADTVKVYYVGHSLKDAVSKEFCGGPHVERTGKIGRVKIKKQDKIGSNLMRVYLTADNG